MMFGVKNGGGFGGAIDYDLDLDGRHDKDARILAAEGVDVYYNAEGQLDADSRQLARSFRAQTMMNPDVKKCVKHLWISYKPEDQLAMVNNAYKGKRHFNTLEEAIDTLGQKRVNEVTDKAMVQDTKRFLKGMGYYQTQFLIVRHSEKDNPHVHVILNMVDNEGNRLNDFKEKKRGIEICKQITLDRNYTWGEHKSVSETISHNPKENARAEICKEIFDISKRCNTAEDMKNEAARRNIEVRYSTDYLTGHITGISFSKDDFLFPASKVDSSLSANKLFPSQGTSLVPLSELPLQAQNTVKNGGIVSGFNNQTLRGAMAPELPQSVQESRTRDEYHKAIEDAEKAGSRTAYMQNVAGLALDPKCGPSQKRAEAVSPYIIDEQNNQAVDVQRIHAIVRIADEQARQKKSIFQRFLDFLRNLMKGSMNLKKYSILTEKNQENIHWSDIREGVPGKVVGLASSLRASIEQAYNSYKEEQARKQKEAQSRQTPAQSQSQTAVPSVKPSRQKESKGERKSIGIKFHR